MTTYINPGLDVSGNGNNWTTNNINWTSSGVTFDTMTDVPTLTSATAANYCVLNPLDNGGNTLSDGNLTIVSPTSTAPSTRGTFGVSSGKYYWEVTIVAANGSIFGIANSAHTITSDVGSTSNSWGYLQDGRKANSGSYVSYGASYTNGDVIGVALDMDAGTLTFYKNNTSQGVAYSSLTGTMFPCVSDYSANSCTWNFNFGQRGFTYAPPSGFVALNTFNLPTPTIGATASTQANKYFDATLWTGNGGTQSVVNAGGFQPDLVWAKNRTTAYNPGLWDSIRGATNALYSSLTNAEGVESGVSAFNSNGFSVGSSLAYNKSSDAFVGWQWRANGTPAVTNTAGSITSTVSANTSSGFSVVTYTGVDSPSTNTIGHGLGVKPSFWITKNRSNGSGNWVMTYVSPVDGNIYYLFLNTTQAASAQGSPWNTQPTSSVITLGANDVNTCNAGENYVSYVFSQVAGYSKFGSYTGNGSTDGSFIYTGFRPRYMMIKGTFADSNWIIIDTARSPYNTTDDWLLANSSTAELTDFSFYVDAVSNGFKLRGTNLNINNSGDTYIYMAFAESPFKYANAR